MPCRSQKDVQTTVTEGPTSNENGSSYGKIGITESVKVPLSDNTNSNNKGIVSNEDKVKKGMQKGSSGDGDYIQENQHQTVSENELNAPRKKVCLCCTAADIQTEDSLTPIDRNKFVEKDPKEESESDDEVDEEQEEDSVKIRPSPKRRRKPLKNVSKNPKYYVDDESQGKSTMTLTSKKGKYTLPENDEETDETDKMNGRPMPEKRPQGKKNIGMRMVENQVSSSAENEESESKERPKKRRGKKKKELDTDEAMEMRSIYENQIASLQESPTRPMPPPLSTVDLVITGPPTVEMEEDLLENAEEERRKNKQRLREKRRKEKDSPVKTPQDDVDVVYESAQKEIDKVLGPRKDAVGKEKPKKKSSNKDKKKKKEKSENSGDSNAEDDPPSDTLEEARVKIHRLLDDAFSLISQSRSSMGNKVHPTSQQSSVDKGSPRSQQSRRSHSSLEPEHDVGEPIAEEKKHTPLFVERSHGAYDRSGLISWSPYRASDDMALISLPNTQTNLDNVAPQRETITGTTVFSESLPNSLQNNFYTTLPGEPIVLHTKDLDSNHPHHQSQENENINVKSRPSTQELKGHKGHDDGDLYSPYYGMSSYHELPPSSVVPNSSSSEKYHDIRNGDYSNSDHRNNYRNLNDDNLKPHNAPSRGESKDFVDVIKHSVQPGASPQPLIHSLREELMNLSRKKGLAESSQNTRHAGDGSDERFSKSNGKSTSSGQDVYYRDSRNRHMKTEL